MIHIRRVLCGIDFSEHSRAALVLAARMARRFGARVTAVHVAPAPAPEAALALPTPMSAEMLRASRDDVTTVMPVLERFVRGASSDAALIDTRVRQGSVWRELAAEAAEGGIDLVVLGTHGRGGFERLFLGSVTEKMLRASPCSVLTVPAPAPLSDTPVRYTRLLAATDFSPAARAAVAWASTLAQQDGAELVLLHVLESPAGSATEGFPRSTLAAYRRTYREWAERQLHDTVPLPVRARCRVREMTVAGRPYSEIVRAAEHEACGLIVIGVQGHRALGDRLFGSTGQHIVRTATVPVLAVKPQPA